MDGTGRLGERFGKGKLLCGAFGRRQVAGGFWKAVERNLAEGGRCFGACFRSRVVVKLGHVQVAGMKKDVSHKSIDQRTQVSYTSCRQCC
jgi:hypothetical protein